MKKCGLWRSGS